MRTHLLWGILAVMMVCALPARTAMAAGDLDPPRSYGSAFTRKLGRGVCNVFSAPLELLRMPSLVSRDDGGLAGATVGVVRGAWAGLVRAGAGAVDVLTFPFPLPWRGWDPLVTPEFVYAHGDWAE